MEAHFENRIYYFNLEKHTTDTIIVIMYSTIYTLIKKDGEWINDTSNRMAMSAGLIQAVVAAVN